MKTPHSTSRTATVPRATASFGPVAHNAWTLDEVGVSLVRQPRRPKTVQLDAQPQRITLDIVRSVLVVVDMQNDFCHPRGGFGQKGISVKPMRKPIAAIAALAPAWRAVGGTVLWLNWGVRAIHFIVRQLHGFTARSADLITALAAPSKQRRPSSANPR